MDGRTDPSPDEWTAESDHSSYTLCMQEKAAGSGLCMMGVWRYAPARKVVWKH